MPFLPPSSRPFYQQVDESEIKIDGVTLKLDRANTLRLPFEVSLVIPRAEIRRRYYEGGQVVREEEVNLSGVTLVHSPRYPSRRGPSGGKPPFPLPPPAGEAFRATGKSRPAAAVPPPPDGGPPRVNFLFPPQKGHQETPTGCGEGGCKVK